MHASFSLNPYVGVDCYHAWMKPKHVYGDFFAKSFPGLAAYMGTKIYKNIGFEVGYSNAHRTHTVTRRSSLFPSAIVTGQIKIIRHEAYMDLVGFLSPSYDCFELFGTLGYGVVKPEFSSAFSPTRSESATDAVAFLKSLKGKVRGVFRAGFGVSYMATPQVGLRAKIGWEGTSALRIVGEGNSTRTRALSHKAFQNSTTINLGVFLQF